MISVFANEAFLVFLGVNLLLAWGLYPMVATGQLSVGQAGFMAVGAYASSWATVELGWPLALALAFGFAAAGVAAAPVAVGANRIRGIYLIIGTLAVGEILQVALTTVDALGGVQGYFGMGGVTLRHVWLVCGLVLAALFVLTRTRVGVAMRSVRDDQDVAEALGVPTRGIKIGAVVVGAAITGLAGALQAHYLLFIQPDNFGVQVSFVIALFVLVGGSDNLAGPAVGAFVLTYLPEAIHVLQRFRGLVYGAFLLAVMILSPRGLVTRERVRSIGRLVGSAVPRKSGAARAEPPTVAVPGAPPGPAGEERAPGTAGVPETDGASGARSRAGGPSRALLRLSGVGKHFGGVVALEDVSMEIRPAEVVGLIGPNGAGKTTLVNVASGLVSPSEGRVELAGEDVTHLSPHRRVRRGIARTFQSVKLFPDLTVGENVSVASGRSGAGGVWPALERVGLAHRADELPTRLPYGLQRRIQLAQAVASAPQVVLLDEPSIGMNAEELADVASLVRSLRDEGRGILLVDHNLDLVTTLADRIVVLDFGRVIAEGTPEEIVGNDLVQEAYLGMPAPGNRVSE